MLKVSVKGRHWWAPFRKPRCLYAWSRGLARDAHFRMWLQTRLSCPLLDSDYTEICDSGYGHIYGQAQDALTSFREEAGSEVAVLVNILTAIFELYLSPGQVTFICFKLLLKATITLTDCCAHRHPDC